MHRVIRALIVANRVVALAGYQEGQDYNIGVSARARYTIM